MINSINSGNNYQITNKETQNNSRNIDVKNITPNELENIIDTMYKNGELTLKDTLPFKPLSNKLLSEQLNIPESGIKVRYSSVWDNKNTRRNMLNEFQEILKKQINEQDSQSNIEITRNAIRILELIRNKNSFGNMLADIQDC